MQTTFDFRNPSITFVDEIKSWERRRHMKELHDAKERAIHRRDWQAADRILKTLRVLSK